MTAAIIQARMGSTRLPGKVLMMLAGKTVLEHVVERVSRAKLVDDIVVATTTDINDSKIVELCTKKGIKVFCGPEDDVLDRYYQAAKHYGIDNVIRITSDCPLIDPDIIDGTVRLYLDSGSDYVSNGLDETFPDGLDVEVISFKALNIAWEKAALLSEREHVTPYIRNNNESFKIASYRNDVDLSAKRWTLDMPEDLEFIRRIMDGIYADNPEFSMNDVLEYIRNNPDIEDINSHIVRNEGYLKSLKNDVLTEKVNNE